MNKVISAVVIVVVVVVAVVLLAANKANAPASPTKTNSSNSQNQTKANTDNNASTNSTSSPSTANNSSTATDKVTISGYAFSPANLTVKKGTTVTWTNNDAVAHTVTETDGQTGPKSGDLNQGQTYSFTFDTVGTFKYDCSIHPYMTGTVTVTD